MPLPTPSFGSPEDNARHFDPAPRELVGGAVPLVPPAFFDDAEMHFDRWPYWEAFSRPSFEDWQFDILLTLHQGDDTIGLTCGDRIDDAPGGIPDGYLLPGAVGSFLHPLGISAEAQHDHVA